MKRVLARQQTTPRERDWYYDADPIRRREYDAFGPWIGVVRSFDDMPPRFQSAYDDLQASDFLFKIPISADRRSVRPGMDLYRAVLSVSKTRVVVLEWNGTTVQRYDSPMSQIQAMRIDQDLLPTTLSLLLRDGKTVTLGYSSVSDREMEPAIHFLRQRMNPDAPVFDNCSDNLPERPNITIGDSFYLTMWWKHVRRSPTASMLYWEQPGIRVGRLKANLGCLMVDTGSELVIVHRGRFVRRWLEAVYSSAELYIPWSKVEAVDLIQVPKGRRRLASTLQILAHGHVIDVELAAPNEKQERLLADMRAHIA